MKEEKKYTIHEFDMGIYPRKLWIAVGVPDDVLRDLFDKEDITDFKEWGAARTIRTCRNKPDRMGGVLIQFAKKAYMTPDNIAHEAAHAAWFVMDYCDVELDADHQEAFAYLVGWIVKMTYSVIHQKEEEDKIINYTIEDGKKV